MWLTTFLRHNIAITQDKFQSIYNQYILWNNQQMQLYAVNFIPLLGSLYMFRGVLHAYYQEYNF